VVGGTLLPTSLAGQGRAGQGRAGQGGVGVGIQPSSGDHTQRYYRCQKRDLEYGCVVRDGPALPIGRSGTWAAAPLRCLLQRSVAWQVQKW
jgi:hypothetical protein